MRKPFSKKHLKVEAEITNDSDVIDIIPRTKH